MIDLRIKWFIKSLDPSPIRSTEHGGGRSPFIIGSSSSARAESSKRASPPHFSQEYEGGTDRIESKQHASLYCAGYCCYLRHAIHPSRARARARARAR